MNWFYWWFNKSEFLLIIQHIYCRQGLIRKDLEANFNLYIELWSSNSSDFIRTYTYLLLMFICFIISSTNTECQFSRFNEPLHFQLHTSFSSLWTNWIMSVAEWDLDRNEMWQMLWTSFILNELRNILEGRRVICDNEAVIRSCNMTC